MKNNLMSFSLIVSVLIIFQSCSKQAQEAVVPNYSPDIVTADISVNQPFELSLDNSVGADISRQAAHALVSETALNTFTGSLVYKYVPATGFSGTDEVILTVRRAISTGSTSSCPAAGNVSSKAVSFVTNYKVVKINVGKPYAGK